MKRVLDCHHTRAGNPAILSSDSCLLTSTFLLLLILAAPALCAGKWQVAYFYDKEGSSLVINDLQYPSPARGIAVPGALLHIINNALTKVVLFLSAGNIHRAYGSKTIDMVSGALRRVPLSGALFLAGFLAIKIGRA